LKADLARANFVRILGRGDRAVQPRKPRADRPGAQSATGWQTAARRRPRVAGSWSVWTGDARQLSLLKTLDF